MKTFDHQIPQVVDLLDLLCGDFTNVSFGSWAEQFVAELLFQNPALCPSSMSKRAEELIRDYDSVDEATVSLICIMQGDSGKFTSQLFRCCLGSTGVLSWRLVRTCTYIVVMRVA